jgi:hypothetical protein
MRPGTAAAASSSYGGVVPSGYAAAPAPPPASAGIHRPRSRRVSQGGDGFTSRPDSGGSVQVRVPWNCYKTRSKTLLKAVFD